MVSWFLWEVEINLEVEVNVKVEVDVGCLIVFFYL